MVLLMISCHNAFEISVSSDGRADVKHILESPPSELSNEVDTLPFNDFYFKNVGHTLDIYDTIYSMNPIISDFSIDTDSTSVITFSYAISSIDSLGNFLLSMFPMPTSDQIGPLINFHYKDSGFVITKGNLVWSNGRFFGKDETDKLGQLMTFDLIIYFEKKIATSDFNTTVVKVIDDHTLELAFNLIQLEQLQNNLLVEITFTE